MAWSRVSDAVRSHGKSRAEVSVPATSSAASGPWPRPASYTAAVIVCGLAVLGLAIADLGRQGIRVDWLVLLALTAVSGWATLRVPSMPISFSISDIFSIASALIFGPAAGAISAAVDGLVLSVRMASSRRSLGRLAFNASAPAVATWLAAHSFVRLAGLSPHVDGPAAAFRVLGAVTVFATIAYGVNTGLVAIAVGLERRLPMRAVWRQHFSGLWLNYLGGAFGGMLLMLLARLHTVNAIILLIPLPLILYMAFRHVVGRTQDQIANLGKVNRVYVAAIEALAQTVDAKDQVTHDHVRRVETRSVELARALGVEDEQEIQAIKAASLLHDIGKLAIPEHILNKPGRLTPAEYEIMKRHAPIGADILAVIDFPYPIVPIVRHHHENWDGTGYPDGLDGERIPIGARILAVVDCFDALVSDRPYRPRMTDAEALNVIRERRGTMYDPRIVDTFIATHSVDLMPGTPAPDVPAGSPASRESTDPASRETGRQATVLLTFFQLGCAFVERRAQGRALDLVAEHLQPHLPEVTLVLYLYDQASDTICTAALAGSAAATLDPVRISLGERLSGWVAATGETIMNSDARLDFDEATRSTSPLRSALAVPLLAGDRLVGVLTAYAREEAAFTDRHKYVLQAAAGALGSVQARGERSVAGFAQRRVS